MLAKNAIKQDKIMALKRIMFENTLQASGLSYNLLHNQCIKLGKNFTHPSMSKTYKHKQTMGADLNKVRCI